MLKSVAPIFTIIILLGILIPCGMASFCFLKHVFRYMKDGNQEIIKMAIYSFLLLAFYFVLLWRDIYVTCVRDLDLNKYSRARILQKIWMDMFTHITV